MTMGTTDRGRAVALWWKDLERWVIPSGVFLRHGLPFGWTRVRIGDIVNQVSNRVKTEGVKVYKMAGVRWYGEGVFHRETVTGDELSASHITPLVPGALIYNRLFAWKAAFAVVSKEYSDCFVSNEFPQFIMDPKHILPEYMFLFCTREATIRAVNSASSGSSAVSRNRFKEEEFLAFEIPLPPLVEQEAIVDRWRKAKEQIAFGMNKATGIAEELETGLLERIGLNISSPLSQRGAFGLTWSAFERWDTFFYRKDFVILKESLSKMDCARLGQLAHFISRPWSPKNFREGAFHYVEISGVNKEVGIFDTSLVSIENAPSRATTLIREGDLIISTTRPYLGAIAIVPAAYDNCICSSGFALADFVDDTRILKDYLLFFLKSPGGLKQMERRMTGGLYPAITQYELEKIEIPLPTLEVQKEIVMHVMSGREEIKREKDLAIAVKQKIYDDIDALILGAKKVSEI